MNVENTKQNNSLITFNKSERKRRVMFVEGL